MALPKLETAVYTLTVPSTDEEIKYRPFLVKEQKRMIMAQESKDDKQILDAMIQLIRDCTFNKVDPSKCPLFDAEYIFLQIRAKSVGETISVNITCPDDEKTIVSKTIPISEINISVFDDHINEINITDDIKITFDYPLLTSYATYSKASTTEMAFAVINDCLREISWDDKTYNKTDITNKELTDFIDNLSNEQFEKLMKFFETMPKLRHVLEVENPKTKVKSEVTIEGLQSFLV
jgi:hypothetical protein|tara:strand:+ start:690 stop:1394 length:705 start_codon:yes stop_codon:yes gene_type:complete